MRLGLVFTAAIAAAVIVTFFVIGGDDKLGLLISAATVHPHESTAEWVSDDAVGYASLNLRPGLSELLRARSFFENIADFEEADEEINDGIDELSEMFGTDLRDVLPALGPELAVAAYERNNFQEADVIAFIGFLDMETGRSLVDSYVTAAIARGEEVETTDHDGVPLHYITGSAYVMVHPVEPYILIASSEEVLDQTLAMMVEPVNPLSEDPDFTAAMERLPDNRFLSGYANLTGLMSSGYGFGVTPIPGVMPLPGDIPVTPTPAETGETQALAGAITVGEKDLRMDYVTNIGVETYESITVPEDSLDLIPANLIGFMNMGGLQSYIDQMLTTVEQLEAEETLFDAFKEETGLDLQTDVLDLIGDEFAVVLTELESAGPNVRDPFTSLPYMDGLLLIEVTDVSRMEATMERVRELAAESGMEFTAVDIDGTQAWVAEMPDMPEGSAQLELAFMFKDGFFIGALSTEALDTVRQVAEGDLDSVRDNDAYERVTGILGDDSVMTLFVESEPLAQSVRSFIPAEDLAEFDERYAPWFEKIEAFAMTTEVDGEWVLTTGILTIN